MHTANTVTLKLLGQGYSVRIIVHQITGFKLDSFLVESSVCLVSQLGQVLLPYVNTAQYHPYCFFHSTPGRVLASERLPVFSRDEIPWEPRI